MHFDSFFRQFFGPSFFNKRPSEEEEQDVDSHYSAINKILSNSKWNNELEQLDRMMIKLLQESFANLSIFNEIPKQQKHTANPVYPSVSLRDQMLKPGVTNQLNEEGWNSGISVKANLHLDEPGKNGRNFAELQPKVRDDAMHYSTRSSANYFHTLDGAIESKAIMTDRDGCHRELITKEFGGKKYVMETKQCPGAPTQTTETLVNMTREELPEFLKNWRG